MVTFFTALSHRRGCLKVQINGVKRSRLYAMIGGSLSTLSVPVLHGSLVVTIIVIDSSKKQSLQLGYASS